MKESLRSLFRELRFRTPLRRFSPSFHSYDYMFSPAQLAFLVRCLDETHGLPDPILEVGCALGKTTLYLDRHLTSIGDDRRYLCIDTFSGFVADDVAFESEQRHKPRALLDGFRVNQQSWFDQNLRDNGVTRVSTFQADIKQLDVARHAPRISFALLDVDLYQPIKVGLGKLVPLLAPGGIVIVDDVKPNNTFDGAHQAYLEYTEKHRLEPEIVLGKLGVIRAPR